MFREVRLIKLKLQTEVGPAWIKQNRKKRNYAGGLWGENSRPVEFPKEMHAVPVGGEVITKGYG